MSSGSPRWFERSKQLVQRPRAARPIFGERLVGELGERVRRAFEQFVPTLSDASSSRMAAAKASCSASGSLEAASNAFLRALVIWASVRRTTSNLVRVADGLSGMQSGFAKISKVAIEPQSGDLDRAKDDHEDRTTSHSPHRGERGALLVSDRPASFQYGSHDRCSDRDPGARPRDRR